MQYKISVVIRTYNEGKHIKEVLDILNRQTYKNFEIILVDSESNDNTVNIAKEYDVKIVTILKNDFDYSYSSNIGVKESTGEIICFLSGHSVPVDEYYLEETNKVFQNPKVGGCYGDVIALEDGSIYEKIYNKLGVIKNKVLKRGNDVVLEDKFHKGMLSCSNASIRKAILIEHPFASELGKNGGEDLEVAYRILKKGMVIAMNPRLLVKHSHGNNFKNFIREIRNWKTIYNEVLTYIEKNE